MRTSKIIALAVLTLGLSTAVAIPAFAEVRPNQSFKVSGVGPYQFLHLMNAPDEASGVQILVPGTACHLRATGATQGPWVEVSYRANNGFDYIGWVESWMLTPERGGYEERPRYRARAYGVYDPQPAYVPPVYEAPVQIYQPPVVASQPVGYAWRHQHDHYYGF